MAVNSVRRQRPLLGTFVEIGVVAAGSDADAALDAGFAAIGDIHDKLSFQNPDSELSRLNRAPGVAIKLSARSLRVLKLALAMMRASGGLFDCTVGGALVRRGILPAQGGPPPLDHGHCGDVVLGPDWALLRRPIRLTLDGIAKGYAIDCAVASLRRQGITAGWINAGGDVRAFGSLSLPLVRRELDGSARRLGYLQHAAVASSRVAARPSARYPGYIVSGGAGSPHAGLWTVMARSAWRADALTKVASLVAAPQRQRLLARLGGVLLSVPVACAR